METKLNYKVISQEAYAFSMYFDIFFVVGGKKYLASCTYYDDYVLTDYLVEDDNGEEVKDDEIVKIGHYLLENMDITKENLTW